MTPTLDDGSPRDRFSELPIVTWLRTLRRRWRAAVVSVLAVLLAAAFVTVVAPKRYSATAELYFREDAISQAASGQFVQTTAAPTQDPATVAATNLRLLTLPVVANQAASLLGGHYTGRSVSEKISVEPEGQSDILGITATDSRASEAARIANAYARGFLSERQQADRAALLQTVSTLQQQLRSMTPAQRSEANGQLLSSRVQDLTILASLQTGGAEFAQPATVPSHPSSPNTSRNLVLGLLVGLVLAALVVATREHLDRRIRDVDEANSLYGRPMLGVVPRLDPATANGGGGMRDPVGLILAHLRYFNTPTEIKVVMVTSAESEDGKTTLAWNLAQASASAGRKTLLLEADLRRPVLSMRHSFTQRQSLSDVLAGLANWRDAICQVSLNGSSKHGALLDVLPAGKVLNPDDLIGSDRLPALLQTLRREYEFIVIDSAPPTMVADALPLVTAADGIIAVVRANKSMRATNELLRDQLAEMNGRVLGVVLNDVPLSDLKYGYGYGYAARE